MPTLRTASSSARPALALLAAAALALAGCQVVEDSVPAGDDVGRPDHHRASHGAAHGSMPMVEVPSAAHRPPAPALAAATSRTGARGRTVTLDPPRRVGSLSHHPAATGAAVQRYAVQVRGPRTARAPGRQRRQDTRWRTVATGRWAPDRVEQTATFRPVLAERVRLVALGGGTAPRVGRIALRGVPGPPVSGAPQAAGPSQGRWGDPIGLPIVPTTAILLPHDKVLTMSAYTDTDYDYTSDLTQVSILDVAAGTAGRREVSETQHQMFCTGVSVLPDGRVLLTGGSSASNATLYDPATDEFSRAPQMAIPRGYQTSVTLSDGGVFTIGGSWSGGRGHKKAEVLDPDAEEWRVVRGAKVGPIRTDDEEGVFRADNHAWLFADREGSVFHAGPSRAMHWFSTQGDGGISKAGRRGKARDQMNGNAVMYARGRILTVGGAPSYSDSRATRRAWTVDIRRGPGHRPEVRAAGRLSERRALLNSVVLPTGEVLVTGGQRRSLPFSDAASELNASLWSPETRRFRELAAAAVPRNYHSWSLLLADGRVLAGGGGLCGDCEVNHPDAEIFTPPYLVKSDGSRRTRPHLESEVPALLRHGQDLMVRTDRRIASWALVRTGSATHSINSDQRRIRVPAQGRPGGYRLEIPRSRGALIPGSYLLFAVDRGGTPSKGEWVRIP